MNHEESRILYLLQKYQNNTATPQELEELDLWYESFESAPKLTDRLTTKQSDLLRDKMLGNITQGLPSANTGYRFRNKRVHRRIYAIAATVLLIAIFFLLKTFNIEKSGPLQIDVTPGKNTAHLILSDGSVIDLEKAKTGTLYNTSDLVINKDSAGLISYHFKTDVQSSNMGDNSIVIPSGGQFRVILADGTKVWMNAKSKFTFPVRFADHIRPVSLTGEAYFEVAKNKEKPFFVHTPKQVIKVLGTHFNVNAYTDERTQKTTLLEGLVQITTTDKTVKTVIIQPGQQAQQDDQMIQIRSVDTDVAVGWKNGLFVFDHTELHDLMSQLSRWYNVEVIYRGKIGSRDFSGEIYRDYSLSEVLRVLSLGSVHFKIEGPASAGRQKRLIITQ